MGMRFRKSIKAGPFCINFSKSGIGMSFGVKGARVTRTAKGTTRSTVSLPGAGLSFVEESSRKSPVTKSSTSKKQNKQISRTFSIILTFLLTAIFFWLFGQPAQKNEPNNPAAVPAATTFETLPIKPKTTVPTSAPEFTSESTTEATAEAATEATTEATEPEYDFVLNTSSLKVHTSSCSSVRKIAVHNRQDYFGTVSSLKSHGYSACAQCKPY